MKALLAQLMYPWFWILNRWETRKANIPKYANMLREMHGSDVEALHHALRVAQMSPINKDFWYDVADHLDKGKR